MITARYGEHVAALQGMNHELARLEIPDIADYEPVRFPAATAEHELTWLFDSKRDYLSQIDAYKAYSRGKT